MSDKDVTLVLTKSVKSQKGHVTVPQQQPTGYFSSTVQCPINFNPFSTSFFVWSKLFIITKHELQWVGISCCSLCTRLIRSSCCAELCSRGWAELGNLKEISCVPIILFFFVEATVWFFWKLTVHSISRRRGHMKYDWLGLGRIWLAAAPQPHKYDWRHLRKTWLAAAASWRRLRWLLMTNTQTFL